MHFVAETEAGNVCAQEPVINIKDVPEDRFRLECIVCRSTAGACVQCIHMTGQKRSGRKHSAKGKGWCNRPFHVGCAAYFDPSQAEFAGKRRFYMVHMEAREQPNEQLGCKAIVCPIHSASYFDGTCSLY